LQCARNSDWARMNAGGGGYRTDSRGEATLGPTVGPLGESTLGPAAGSFGPSPRANELRGS